MRAGRYIKQPTSYRAFIPTKLPPDPSIELDAELLKLLSDADRALGRLDGVATVLPNPDLFVAMFVRQEAVLSSQIEGTQSTLQDVLACIGRKVVIINQIQETASPIFNQGDVTTLEGSSHV